MSKSHESYAAPQEDYRAEANSRFLPYLKNQSERARYEEDGITYTNNLKLYLRDVDDGTFSSHDYHRMPFAPVIEEFRRLQDGLFWDAVQEARIAMETSDKAYRQKQNDRDPHAEQYGELASEQKWDYIKILSDAYDILAGIVEESNIEVIEESGIRKLKPLDLCI